MNPQWKFAPNSMGESEGPNDPGISTFTNDRAGALVREFLQNSIDARKSENEPVVVSFSLEDIPTDNLDLDRLADSIRASCDSPDNDKRHKAQFSRGLNALKKSIENDRIPALVVLDSNTTGAPEARGGG